MRSSASAIGSRRSTSAARSPRHWPPPGPMSPSTCSMPARRGRHAARALLEILGIAYTHSGVLASGARHAERHRQGAISRRRRPGRRRPWWCRALRRRKAHLMAPPYVVKPIAEGSSVGVYIVTEEHPQPAPGALPGRLARSGKRSCWSATSRARSSPAPSSGTGALDVIEIVPGHPVLRLPRPSTPPAAPNNLLPGANFTKCLPGGPKTRIGCRH